MIVDPIEPPPRSKAFPILRILVKRRHSAEDGHHPRAVKDSPLVCRTPPVLGNVHAGQIPPLNVCPPPRLPLSTDIDAGSDAAGVVKAAGAAIPPGLTTIPTSIPNSNVGIWCYCHGNRLVSVESEEKDMVHITDPHPRAQSRPESRTIQPRSCVWVDFLNSLPPFRTRKPPING